MLFVPTFLSHGPAYVTTSGIGMVLSKGRTKSITSGAHDVIAITHHYRRMTFVPSNYKIGYITGRGQFTTIMVLFRLGRERDSSVDSLA